MLADWYDRYFGWFWAVVAALTVGACGAVVVAVANEDERLMDQCMADGHKEYECRSMLRDNRPPPPVIIHH